MKNNNEKRGGAERLFDAVTEIDHDLVDGSRPKDAKRRSHAVRKGIIAAVVAAAMALGVVGGIALHERRGKNAGGADEKTPAPVADDRERFNPFVVSAEYPVYETAKECMLAAREAEKNVSEETKKALISIAKERLTNAENKNAVIAPVSIYMALGVLSEVSAGETQQQILDLLNADNTDVVGEQVGAIWDTCYSMGDWYKDALAEIDKEFGKETPYDADDGVHSLIGASLWLDNRYEYNMDLLESVAEKYKASSFIGQFGTEEYNEVFREWLAEQTQGVYPGDGNVGFDPKTTFAVATSIYFKSSWSPSFDAEKNTDGIFHGATKDDNCVYMNEDTDLGIYRGDGFLIAEMLLSDPGSRFAHVWFALPDEGQSVDAVASSDELWEFITSCEGQVPASDRQKISLSMPKFSVENKSDFIPYLRELGVTDVFDAEKADFSPLGKMFSSASVGLFDHNVHVSVNENGLEGAGYSTSALMKGIDPSDPIDEFILDRPFAFFVTTYEGLPLFAGVVNQIN